MPLAGGVPLLATRLKAAARVVVAHALYHAGVLRMLQNIRLRRKAVVLTYHRVLTSSELRETGSHPGIIVSDETFARHLALLKRRFKVLSIEEFAEHVLHDVSFPDSSCLVTFDDGWADNYVNAWPYLQEAGVPALIFLPVNFIGSDRRFWRESLTLVLSRTLHVLREAPERREPFRVLLDEAGLGALLDVPADARAAVSEALDALKGSDPDYIKSLIGRLRAELGPERISHGESDRFMTWAEVTSLSRRGVAFGGHGAEHVLLDRVPDEVAGAEIETAMAEVSRRAPMRVPAFSYPNGNWTAAIAAKVRASGFRLAFTTESGPVDAADDPFTLRRVNISEDATHTTPLFLARLLGLF